MEEKELRKWTVAFRDRMGFFRLVKRGGLMMDPFITRLRAAWVGQRASLHKSLTELPQNLIIVGHYISSAGSLLLGSAAQMLVYVVLARHLGIEDFATLITITAVTDMSAHFCGMGVTETMVRRVSRDPSLYPVVLGHCLITIAVSGVILTPLIVSVLSVWFPISAYSYWNFAALGALVVSNVVLGRWIYLIQWIFLARSQFIQANLALLAPALMRLLIAVVACMAFAVDRLEVLAFWYLGGHIILAIAAAVAIRSYGKPRWQVLPEEIRHGFFFALPFIFVTLRQNIDLIILSALTSPSVVGSYGMVRRIFDVSMTGVDAINRLAFPRLCIAAKSSLRHSYDLGIKILGLALAIGFITSLVLYVCAPITPWLFGNDFDNMVPYLRIICWAVILVAVTDVAQAILGSAERYGTRATIETTGNVVGSAIGAVLTWQYLVYGTFVTIYVTEAALMAAFWIVLWRLAHPTCASSLPQSSTPAGAVLPSRSGKT